MMSIKAEKAHGLYEYSWWAGNPVPPTGRITTIVADGHELQLLLLAMARGYVGPSERVELQEAPHGEGA